MEGEQKMQGEKPLNTEERNRQNNSLQRELVVFVDRRDDLHTADLFRRAYDRATELISKYRTF